MTESKGMHQKVTLKRFIGSGIISNLIGLVFLLSMTAWESLTLEALLYNAGYSTMLGYGMFYTGYVFYYFEEKWISWVDYPVRSIFIALGISTFYCTLVILITNWVWFIQIYDIPLKVFTGKMMRIVWIEYAIFYFVALWFYARSFLMQWRTELENKEKLKREALSLQYEALKTQVNPHFLFNSLNVLTSLIDKDTHSAKAFTAELSRFYRDILQLRNKEIITLNEELTILKRYIYLQQIRFGTNFEAHLPANTDQQAMVIPLSVQMLVENVFKHNSISSQQPLKLEVTLHDHQLCVSNSFQPKTVSEPPSGIGLQNLKERYLYLTGKEVAIHQDEDYYSVTLPLIYL